jgi:hypothetical protein
MCGEEILQLASAYFNIYFVLTDSYDFMQGGYNATDEAVKIRTAIQGIFAFTNLSHGNNRASKMRVQNDWKTLDYALLLAKFPLINTTSTAA